MHVISYGVVIALEANNASFGDDNNDYNAVYLRACKLPFIVMQ